MRRLTAADASRVVAFVDGTTALDTDEPMPASVLIRLTELIPGSFAEYVEFDDVGGLRSYASTMTPPEGSAEAMWAANRGAITGDPLRPQDGAARMSDLMPPLRKRTPWYFNQVVAFGFRDVVKVALPTMPLRSLLMIDRDADFSVRDRDVLGLLQAHLAAIRNDATTRRAMRRYAPSLSPREAEVLGGAARGWTNEEIAMRLRISRATVTKHLENAYLKLDAHSRSEAVVLAGLYLRDLAAGPSRVPGPPTAGRDSVDLDRALTPRELEVLSLAARGRRNDQIAEVLFIAPRTVAKHLELAYDKLGARSRLEAVAVLRGPAG